MEKSLRYASENKDRFLEELFSLIRIPSISAQSEHKGDMVKCAEHIKESLLKAGVTLAEVFHTKGNPIVYAEKIISEKAPTVLVYAHYDVMPVEPLSLWASDPFEPVIRDGRIYGRGTNDDKGQSFMHIKAFEAMNKSGELSCNVKFMIEGEEEIGSGSLNKWCVEHKDLLKSDVILVSDTSMLSLDSPSITVGLRGLTHMEVEVTGPNKVLHSGLYGGAVANPAMVLSKMISTLIDDNGHIMIPGFYDDVRDVSAQERELINKAPFDEKAYREALEVGDISGEAGYTTIERTGIRPALDINGIWSGYTGEGPRTIIPSTANAKISMRLVPNQDYVKIEKLFEEYFMSIAPKSVKVKVSTHHGGYPYVSPIDMPAYKAAAKAIKATLGKIPIPFYSGGSIPIISTFEQVLGTKSILIGFGLDQDAIHSPNESYAIENFVKGIDTIIEFYKHFEAE